MTFSYKIQTTGPKKSLPSEKTETKMLGKYQIEKLLRSASEQEINADLEDIRQRYQLYVCHVTDLSLELG